MRNQQNVKVRVNSSFETICPFPVGYVYMSSNSTSPADIYGGTWSAISGGRYMRAAGAWDNGGSNYISIDQLPSHTHGALLYNLGTGIQSAGFNWTGDRGTSSDYYYSGYISSTWWGAAFYPTYQNVYAWYRTA